MSLPAPKSPPMLKEHKMAEPEFKPRDVVELVSGSAPMVVQWVEEVLGTMSALCHWAERTKTGQDMKEKVFAVVVLQHVKAQSSLADRLA